MAQINQLVGAIDQIRVDCLKRAGGRGPDIHSLTLVKYPKPRKGARASDARFVLFGKGPGSGHFSRFSVGNPRYLSICGPGK